MPQDRIHRIAQLARLALTAEEAQTYSRQVEEVLIYVGQLQELNTDSVKPMFSPALAEGEPLRTDRAVPSPKDPDGTPKVLNKAPDVLHGGFKVPQIV